MYYNNSSIIKCLCFESIHYDINLNIVLSFGIFNEFDYLFLSNILLFRINKIIYLLKKYLEAKNR